MGRPAYLSILRWPDESTDASNAAALAVALGIGPRPAARAVAPPPPAIVARIPAEVAPRALNALRGGGVVAIAPTLDDLAAAPPARKVKALTPAEGAPEPMYLAEFWTGDAAGFRARDIAIMIRARLDDAPRRLAPAPTPSRPDAATPPSEPIRTARPITEVLDLVLTGGDRLRIDGDKFGFAVLGPDRALSNVECMDRLAVRLAGEAPDALIDTAFGAFKVPGGVVNEFDAASRRSRERLRGDTPAFDFYSAWIVLALRELAHPTPAAR